MRAMIGKKGKDGEIGKKGKGGENGKVWFLLGTATRQVRVRLMEGVMDGSTTNLS